MYMLLIFVGAVLLYAAWGALVLMGKADPAGYIAALAAGLTFLGKHVSEKSGGDSGGALAADTRAPAQESDTAPVSSVAASAPVPSQPAVAAPPAAPAPTPSPTLQ